MLKHNQSLPGAFEALRGPAAFPDPEIPLAGEKHLTTLKSGPAVPTLVLSDLEGRYDALVHALTARGFIREAGPGDFSVSEAAKDCRVILNGDTNDRGYRFAAIVTLIAALRKQGLDLRTVVGNHEFFLRSFLYHEPVETVPVLELKLPDAKVALTAETRAGALLSWLRQDGGSETVRSILYFYKADETACTWQALGYDEGVTQYTPLRAAEFGLVRNLVKTRPEFAAYFERMEPFFRDGSLVFAHSAIPLHKEEALEAGLERLKHAYKEVWNDAALTWLTANGLSYFLENGKPTLNPDMTQTLLGHVYRGPLRGLVWSRLPERLLQLKPEDVELLLSGVFSGQTLAQLMAGGVSTLVRGHDPSSHIGAEGQSVFQRGAFTIVNADVELKNANCRGYTFISPQGKVFTHYSTGG